MVRRRLIGRLKHHILIVEFLVKYGINICVEVRIGIQLFRMLWMDRCAPEALERAGTLGASIRYQAKLVATIRVKLLQQLY